MKRFIIFLLVTFCLVMSCNNGDGSTENPVNNNNQNVEQPGNTNNQNPKQPGNNLPELPSEADRVPIFAEYRVEVINNTGATVEITHGGFYKSEKNGMYVFFYNPRTVGNGTFDFQWCPRNGLGYGDDCIIEVGQPEREYTVEEQMKDFDPGIQAFFLRIRMDGNEYYLAGWPQSLELPSILVEPTDSGFTLDTGKIVQYGIGYGDNKEVRVKNYANGDWVYVPYIISIDNDGETEVYDFDNATVVYGEAVLTIDGPDKIEFKTTRLWEPEM